jgi:uncharacterized membrane protein YfcA
VSRLQAWFVHLANLLVGGTGVVYAWLRYGPAPGDPYAVVRHPLQPLVQHLHVWTAPLLVFALGWIFEAHVWRHWRSGVATARRSGVTLLLAAVPMTASGYLLQTAVEPRWRAIWVGVHLACSALWVGGYLAHAWAKRGRPLRAAEPLSPGAPAPARNAASRP